MDANTRLTDALDRLRSVLADRFPEVWAGFRPPASEADLSALERCIAPLALPQDVRTLLCWADGQADDAPARLPILGRLLSARGMIEGYRRLAAVDWTRERTVWNPAHLPLDPVEPWASTGLDLSAEHGAVLYLEWGVNRLDDGWRLAADRLVVAVDAATELASTGFLVTPGRAAPHGWGERLRAARAAATERHGAPTWPFDRVVDIEPEAWPAAWRRTAGLPDRPVGATDPVPIAQAVTRGAGGTVTVEGWIQPPGEGPRGRYELLLADRTGALRLFFDDKDFPGQRYRFLCVRLLAEVELSPDEGKDLRRARLVALRPAQQVPWPHDRRPTPEGRPVWDVSE